METIADVRTWLDDHVNLEALVSGRAGPPTLDRMIELMRLLGEPQGSYPVVHITGTNGKGSTARMVTALLAERGLSVGTCTRLGPDAVWAADVTAPTPRLRAASSALHRANSLRSSSNSALVIVTS